MKFYIVGSDKNQLLLKKITELFKAVLIVVVVVLVAAAAEGGIIWKQENNLEEKIN